MFAKMNIKNPFSASPIVGDDVSLFTNRHKEVQTAFESLKIGKNLLILGDWGAGKTSLLRFLEYKIKKEIKNCKVFNIFLPIDYKESIIKNLLISLIFEFEKDDVKSINNIERLQKNYVFLETIKKASVIELLEILENYNSELQLKYNKIFVMIDEIERINFKITDLSGIRDHLWKLNIAFIFTGNIKSYDIITDSAMEPFFTVIQLSDLNELHAKELIERRIKHYMNKNLSDVIDLNIIPIIYKYSKGNPRRLLRIMAQLTYIAIYKEDTIINKNHLFEMIEEIMNTNYNSNSIHAYLLNTLREKPNGLSVSEIKLYVDGANFEYSRSRISQVLNELKADGLLTSEKIGRKNIYKIIFNLD